MGDRRRAFPNLPKAACKGQPPGWWDSDGSEVEHALAVSVCRRCPEQEPCAMWGRRHRETGMWGGLMLRGGRVTASYGASA